MNKLTFDEVLNKIQHSQKLLIKTLGESYDEITITSINENNVFGYYISEEYRFNKTFSKEELYDLYKNNSLLFISGRTSEENLYSKCCQTCCFHKKVKLSHLDDKDSQAYYTKLGAYIDLHNNVTLLYCNKHYRETSPEIYCPEYKGE